MAAARKAVKHIRVRRGNAEDRAALRRALVDAAGRLFAAGGLEAVTMRAVAAQLGISPMAPYRYYADKAELLSGLWVFVLEALYEAMRAAADGAAPGRARQAAVVDAFLAYWEEHPDHYRLVYMTESAMRPAAESTLTDVPVYDALRALATRVTAEFAAELGVGTEHARLAGDLRFAMQLGYLHGLLVNRRYPWGDRALLRRAYIEQIVAAVANCLRHGAAPARG
jgi:AcrR family transcriptional regulator